MKRQKSRAPGDFDGYPRVLDLRSVGQLKKGDADDAAMPLFQRPELNTSIIIKHRLRGGERDQFAGPRRTATKIMIPIETADLRLGGPDQRGSD